MAFCANCGRAIADSADVCPNCGHPNEAKATAVAAPASVAVPVAELAGWWRRFAGAMIDSLILIVVGQIFGRRNTAYGNAASLLWFLYTWLMLGLNDGRTLGKLVMGIRIAHPDRSKISLGTAALRTAMSIVSGLAVALGYLWAAWDPQRRTWHDIVANTRAFKT